MKSLRRRALPTLVGIALALGAISAPAPAQIGGLIKKKIDKMAGQDAAQPGQNVEFNDVVLELTPERIQGVIAGKRAGRQIAEGPNGPAALREKLAALDTRQTAIYTRNVTAINAWDERRRLIENCRDSALSAIRDRIRPDANPQTLQRWMDLGMALAVAQQKGDAAEIKRLTEEAKRLQEPTPADTAAVVKRCGDPTPPAIVKEWVDIKKQMEGLQEQISASEQAVTDAEQRASGMNARQLAVSCERIKSFIQQLKNKAKHTGFSDQEIKNLQNLQQAIKDLEELCP